jgi:hypothetical protein
MAGGPKDYFEVGSPNMLGTGRPSDHPFLKFRAVYSSPVLAAYCTNAGRMPSTPATTGFHREPLAS